MSLLFPSLLRMNTMPQLLIGSQAKAKPTFEIVCAKPHKVTGQRMRIASDNAAAIAGYFDRNGTNK